MMSTFKGVKALIAAGVVLVSGGADGRAQELTVLAHPSIQASVMGTTGTGGDTLADWRTKNGTKINWVTADIGPLHDRLMREANLSSTAIDVGLILDSYATQAALSKFEPLDACLKGLDFSDIPQTFLDQVTQDGKLKALPIRHATTALHYNAALLAEKGIQQAPASFEDLVKTAKALSERGAGRYGLSIDGTNAGGTFNVLMAYGATLTDAKGQVSADAEALTRAFQALADLYAAGALPSNFTAMGIDQITQGIWQGRIAMSVQPFNRYLTYNDKAKTDYAGQIKVAAFPATEGQTPPFVARTTVWSAAIPAASKNKERACALLRQLADPETVVRMTLNGNGPVRTNAYDDPRVKEAVPYADAEKQAVLGAKFVISPFDGIGKAQDLYLENMQAAALGRKTAAQAARDTLDGIAAAKKK
ncbi:Extracellular solute-binding protein [Hyphomicrobiales bacterium]|nr:Extracellular solute-binding protein [Hyphomicrobiales bacterium]